MTDSAQFQRLCEGKSARYVSALLRANIAKSSADRAWSRYERTRFRRDLTAWAKADAAYLLALQTLEAAQ